MPAAAANFTAIDVYKDLANCVKSALPLPPPSLALGADFLVVPTVMHHYLVSEVLQQETETLSKAEYNANLGTFTNFVNLLGMCAVSVPASELPHIPIQVRSLDNGLSDCKQACGCKKQVQTLF